MGLGTSGANTTNIATKTPQQEEFINQLIASLGGLIPGGVEAIQSQLDPAQAGQFFQENIAAPQREQFFKATIPGIQQAGANLGAKGGTSIDRQLAQAASGLEKDLSRQLAQFQQSGMQQGLQNLQSFSGIGLQSPFSPVHQPQGPGFGQQAMAGIIQALPFILGAL